MVDARHPSVYATRHLTGSLNIGLHGQYALWAGTILERHRPIVLLTEPGHESEATLRLGRIGFDYVAGYLAGGMEALAAHPELTRQTERLTPLTLAAALTSAGPPPLLLDVRTPQERHAGSIAGSRHMPLPRLQHQMHDVPRGARIVVYCAGGYRSSLAVGLLEQHGITPLADLDGGLTAWADAGLETLTPEAAPAYAHVVRAMLQGQTERMRALAHPGLGTQKQLQGNLSRKDFVSIRGFIGNVSW